VLGLSVTSWQPQLPNRLGRRCSEPAMMLVLYDMPIDFNGAFKQSWVCSGSTLDPHDCINADEVRDREGEGM
jgi:hypothetical protein